MANAVTVITGIVGVFVGIFKLYKWFKGKQPKEVIKNDDQSITFKNAEGGSITVNQNTYNVFTNPSTVDTLSSIFNNLDQDGTRDDFNVSNESSSVKFNKEEYPIYASSISLEEIDPKVHVIRMPGIFLQVKQPDLYGNSKWAFYFNKVIRATMEDKEFLDKVANRSVVFGNGDSLEADLRLEQNFDSDGKVIAGSERYFVERVISVKSFPSLEEKQISFVD